jgi:hypothetical protein
VRLGTGSDAATLYNPSQVEKDTPMHVFGAFELDIRPGTPDSPASVRIALLRYARGEDRRLFITPECTSFEEVEGQINSLQDELDEIRERAHRAFQSP